MITIFRLVNLTLLIFVIRRGGGGGLGVCKELTKTMALDMEFVLWSSSKCCHWSNYLSIWRKSGLAIRL